MVTLFRFQTGNMEFYEMAERDFYNQRWKFSDHSVFSTTAADNAPFLVADTSAAGSPTYAVNTPAAAGALKVELDSTSEVQNVCLYQNDKLLFDIDQIVEFGIKVKLDQATVDATTQIAFGLISGRNDAIDSITEACLFRLVGSTTIKLETDDGTTNNDDVDGVKTLGTDFVWLIMSFATGKSDIRFFVDGQPVATGTTFSMAAYAGSLQVMPVQIQKTADTNTDGVIIEECYIRGRNK